VRFSHVHANYKMVQRNRTVDTVSQKPLLVDFQLFTLALISKFVIGAPETIS